jgi:lipid-A-disaccharide synthase
MVNLIAGREVVPELIQGDFTPANVVLHLRRLMHNEKDRKVMKEELRKVALVLHAEGGTAIERVARITLQFILEKGRNLQQSSSELLSKA